MAGIKPEDLQKMIAESVAQALAAQTPAKRARTGRKPASEEEKAKRRQALEAQVIEAFTAEGFNDVQPRVNIMTYDKWLDNGRRVKKGVKAIRCGNFALFHIDQTEPLVSSETQKTDETVH